MTSNTKDTVIQQLFENVRYYQSKFSQSIIIFLGITGYCFVKAVESSTLSYIKNSIKIINIVFTFFCVVACFGFYLFIRRNYQAYQKLVGNDDKLLYAFQEPKWTLYAVCLFSLSAIPIVIVWILIWTRKESIKTKFTLADDSERFTSNKIYT